MNLHVHDSWQAQHFVNLHVQISWQAHYFVNLHVSPHFLPADRRTLRGLPAGAGSAHCDLALAGSETAHCDLALAVITTRRMGIKVNSRLVPGKLTALTCCQGSGT